MSESTTAGVIGAGSFGIAISKLLSVNVDVLLLVRQEETCDRINSGHELRGIRLPHNIRATIEPREVAASCRTLFPVVPSKSIRSSMQALAPHLRPLHYIIHCAKGLDVVDADEKQMPLSRAVIRTMSEVIAEETPVLRIGCLSGPNLANEIIEGQATATLIASEFSEVIQEGQKLLSSPKFFVFGSHDIVGAELAGALKNVFALGSGYLAGRGLGKNIQAMLITRGLHEMVIFGKALGSTSEAFLGTAGIGDLIATSLSKDSRNFRCGLLVGQGKSLPEAQEELDEIAEGVRTLEIAMQMARYYKLQVPITQTLYKLFYDDLSFDVALQYLMSYPYARDVDFL